MKYNDIFICQSCSTVGDYALRIFLSAMLCFPTVAIAQESSQSPVESSTANGLEGLDESREKETGPVVTFEFSDEFNSALNEWKATAKEVVALKMRYIECEEREAQAIRDQITDALFRGQEKIEALQRIARRDFEKSTSFNPELVEFLFKGIGRDVDKDQFDSAYESCDLLIRKFPKGGEKDSNYYGVLKAAAYAAYRSNHFDKAVQYFDEVSTVDELTVEDEDHLRRSQFNIPEWEKELAKRAKEGESDDLPRIRFETTRGDVVVELFEDDAPNTVAHIINLVGSGFYDGLTFHHVKSLYGAQTGCPVGDGSGDPGYHIENETTGQDARRHFRGSVSIIPHDEIGKCGSQIFFSYLPRPDIDGQVTVFGRVISGMDALSKLQRIEISPDQGVADVTPDSVIKAEVLRKRNHAYVPQTLSESEAHAQHR